MIHETLTFETFGEQFSEEPFSINFFAFGFALVLTIELVPVFPWLTTSTSTSDWQECGRVHLLL